MPATHAVGKRTLTEGLEAHGPEAATDPVSALIAKVKRAALAGHARHALELMATADPATQDQIAVAIGPEARHAFARNMPTDIGDSRPTRESSKILFDHTPDSERSTLELLFEARFRLKIGSHPVTQHPRKFDAEGLRRLWLDFQKLPADQVAHNWAVATLDRYQDHDDKDPTHGHGAFSYPQNGPGEIDLSYRDQIIENGCTASTASTRSRATRSATPSTASSACRRSTTWPRRPRPATSRTGSIRRATARPPSRWSPTPAGRSTACRPASAGT